MHCSSDQGALEIVHINLGCHHDQLAVVSYLCICVLLQEDLAALVLPWSSSGLEGVADAEEGGREVDVPVADTPAAAHAGEFR